MDDIAFYQWVYDRAETKSLWDCDVLDKNDEGYLTLWYGDTMSRRAHTWLLAIACLLYSRFPDAVDINGASTATDFLRATAIAGDVVGEPIAIPKKYSKCDVTKVASELMGDADQPKYDCNVVTDLYYWDQEEDSVDTEDIACAQLVNLLVTNYELFQYYWKRHLMSYSTNR